MDRGNEAANPLEDAGYDKEQVLEDVVNYDTSTDTIVYSTSEELVSLERIHGEVIINRLSVPGNEEIDDLATGKASSIYLVVDGDLCAFSPSGIVSEAWEQDVLEVVAPSGAKIVVYVDQAGSINGVESQSRIPKFQNKQFTGKDGEPIVPSLVAGRDGFVAYGGSIVRSYDKRGKVVWKAEFDAEVADLGQLDGDLIVGLANNSIHWVNTNGEPTMEIGGSMDCIAAIGRRMLVGSSDGSLTAFGDNGLAPHISDTTSEDVIQTGNDKLIGILSNSELHLFSRQIPHVNIEAYQSSSGGASSMTIDIENPYLIPLQLEVQIGGDPIEEVVEESIFLTPNSTETATIDLDGVTAGGTLDVDIESVDKTITAFDGTVSVKDSKPDSGKETLAEDEKSPEEETEVSSERVTNQLQIESTNEFTDEQKENFVSLNTGDDEATLARSEETIETPADNSPETTSVESRSDSADDTPGVSVSLDPIDITDSLMTWQVTVENNAEDDIGDVRIEARSPTKFDIEGESSTDIITAGSSFTATGSFGYRSGSVSTLVQWTDRDGETHEQQVKHDVQGSFFEVNAKRKEDPELDQIEFTLINHLDVPVLDSVTINAVGGTKTGNIGKHKLTLNPGSNLLTKHLSPLESLDRASLESYEVTLQSLRMADTVDVPPESSGAPASWRKQTFNRDVGICVNDENKIETKWISKVDLAEYRSNIIVERLNRMNRSDGWIPAESLWTQRADGWSRSNEILPSLQSDDTFQLCRVWQTADGTRILNTKLPAHRLGEQGPKIAEEQYKSITPRVTMYCAFVPVAPSGDYSLIALVENNTSNPIELTGFELENGFPEKDLERYKIEGKSSRCFYFELPEWFESEAYDGLARGVFRIGSKKFVSRAVIINQDNPKLDESKWWFEATCKRLCERDTETLALTINNETDKTVRNLIIRSKSNPSTGVAKTVLNKGESVTLHRNVDATSPARWHLEDRSIYEVTAEIDGEKTSYHVQISVREDASGKEFVAKVLPTKEIFDLDAIIETWPSKSVTGWRYNTI